MLLENERMQCSVGNVHAWKIQEWMKHRYVETRSMHVPGGTYIPGNSEYVRSWETKGMYVLWETFIPGIERYVCMLGKHTYLDTHLRNQRYENRSMKTEVRMYCERIELQIYRDRCMHALGHICTCNRKVCMFVQHAGMYVCRGNIQTYKLQDSNLPTQLHTYINTGVHTYVCSWEAYIPQNLGYIINT